MPRLTAAVQTDPTSPRSGRLRLTRRGPLRKKAVIPADARRRARTPGSGSGPPGPGAFPERARLAGMTVRSGQDLLVASA